MVLNKKTSPAAEAAIEKLQGGMKDVTGQKEKAVAKPVVEALAGFCRQSDYQDEEETPKHCPNCGAKMSNGGMFK